MSEQDKYRQALSAVIGITMESLKGGSMSSHTPEPNGPFYIATNGKGIHTYTCTKDGIRLDDGTEVPEEQAVHALFAVHPAHNSRMRQSSSGSWEYQSSVNGRWVDMSLPDRRQLIIEKEEA